MTHHSQTIKDLKMQNRIFKTALFFTLVGGVLYVTKPQTINPCADTGCSVKVVYADEFKVDELVDTYSHKYGRTSYERNRIKALLHYLLLREQNYGGSDACGDGGKACGPLQFHEPTYISYRNIMIKKGLVKDMGSRLNMKDAIETTAWAISDGREKAWGPVFRGEIKI